VKFAEALLLVEPADLERQARSASNVGIGTAASSLSNASKIHPSARRGDPRGVWQRTTGLVDLFV